MYNKEDRRNNLNFFYINFATPFQEKSHKEVRSLDNRIKPYSGIDTQLYQKHMWETGETITQLKMMNIEEWLASASDELLYAREGFTISREPNRWNTVGERLNYMMTAIALMTPDGAAETIDDLNEKIDEIEVVINNAKTATTNANTATTRANSAAELIENMTVAAQTLSAGAPASIIKWEASDDKYELELGIPVPTFTTSTTTTYDGSTAASVTVDNSNNLSRNLAFSIPVPKFTIKSTSAVTSGNISSAANVTISDNTTLNPKLTFKVPVVSPTASVTTKTSGTIEAAVEKTAGTTLTPNFNFTIPVQKIAGVTYTQATPGTNGNFTIDGASTLTPTLKLTVPVQNFQQVTATPLAAGANPTASIEHINDLNLRLNLGLPLAKPIDVVKTYSSVTALKDNIRNDVAVGYYAIVASSDNDEHNGEIYLRTSTSPYYSFIADIAAVTPNFQIGTIEAANVGTQGTGTIDIPEQDPTSRILNLTIPAIPVFVDDVDVETADANQRASASLSGPISAKKLSLTIPRGAIPNLTVGTVNTGDPGTNASVTISGTAANPVLNFSIPRGNTGSLDNLPIATASTLGGVEIGDTILINGTTGAINVNTGNTLTNTNGAINVNTGNTLQTATNGVINVNIGNTLQINTSGTIDAKTATTSQLGVVKIGNNININSGTISVPNATTATLGVVQIGTGLNIDNGIVSLAAANGTTLGGIKIGETLTNNNSVINVRTASGSQSGIVTIGSNINVESGTISVPSATSSVKGVVSIGNGLAVNDGAISLSKASASQLGGIIVGNTLIANNDGTINVNSDTAPNSANTTKFLSSSVIYNTMPLLVEFTGISSLPTSFSVAGINAQMVVAHYELSNPSAFSSNITVETSDEETVTLSGSMLSGATSDIKITFVVPRDVTPTTAEQIQE